MEKYNIFQGNELLRHTVAKALEYDLTPEKIRYASFTDDIFMSAFFYLTKRFGAPKESDYDEGKEAAAWYFDVKEYTIGVIFNSCWVYFVIYGSAKKFTYIPSEPYWVAYYRKKERLLADGKIIPFQLEDESENEYRERNGILLDAVFSQFLAQKGLSDITPEAFNTDENLQNEWFMYAEQYNKRIIQQAIGCDFQEFTQKLGKWGKVHHNAAKRHALRTLSQFLKNMLTPIYVRDVAYNIKGDCGNAYNQYENNIKITRI